jgi:peptidoglycan hydrolase-like protein with peptidoglycan-binding domain
MGALAGRVATAAMVAGVVLGTSALGYGVVRLTDEAGPRAATVTTQRDAREHSPTTEAATRPGAQPEAQAPLKAQPRRKAVRRQVTAPLPASRPQVTPEPGPRLLGPGDAGPKVRDLQARLRQISWYAGDVTDDYGSSTTTAVKGFQAKREIAVTGEVDQRTLDRLGAMTRTPTADELANKLPGSTTTGAALDPRCATGRAMCVDKSSSTVRWVVGGKVLRTMAVRFGSSYTPTREGLFHVGSKSRDHVSSLYDTAMPFAMFFSGGQAVHYSPDFAARGYAGASHGCVNVRDLAGITWLYDQVAVGDKVVIYWS